MERPRLIIFSDNPLARSGLAAMLAGTNDVVVAASVAPGRAAELAAVGADVALFDAGGSDAESLRKTAATLPVVALVGDELQAMEALAAGARAVVLRNASSEQLVAALVAAQRGLVALDGALARWIRPPPPSSTTDVEGGLTPREVQVLSLLAQGLPNKVIAQRLGVSDRTAKFHVESILAKLGAESRSEAIVIAARRGMITL